MQIENKFSLSIRTVHMNGSWISVRRKAPCISAYIETVGFDGKLWFGGGG